MLASPELSYNLLLKGELLDIAREFERRGVRYYVLKGIPFTLQVFGRLDARAMLDNDVVVAEADVDAAYTTLIQMGFRDAVHPFPASRAANFQQPLHREHPGRAHSLLELHWSPFSPVLFRNGDALFDSLTVFKLGTREIPTLNPTATIVHLATHWLQHGLSKPSILRDLGAAWETFGADIVPHDLLALSERVGARTCLGAALAVATAAGHCNATWPRELLSTRARTLLALLGKSELATTADDSYRRTLASWSLLDNAGPWRALRWELCPPVARMRLIYGQELGPFALATRYLSRPWLALLRRHDP